MINQRQIEILLELCKQADEYLTASYFSKKMNVSLRTIHGDIRAIKEALEKEDSASLNSVVPKGTSLHIEDKEAFSILMSSLYQQQAHVSLGYPSSRLNQILMYLLSQHRAISISKIADEFFISVSTLLNDMKKLQDIIEEYDLDLLRNDNRILVYGSEINKRRYIVEKNMYLTHSSGKEGEGYLDEKQILVIKNLLTDVLIQFRYSMADTDIQNAILMLNIMIKRLQQGFYINPGELMITDEVDLEMDISGALFEKIGKRFLISPSEYEIKYYALYLKGKSNCQNTSMITEDMDAFIVAAFQEIKKHFSIDLTDNIGLRIALALHCVPLGIRIKYNMQMKSKMLDYIKQTFPLGYDIAIFFCLLLEQRYGREISEAEISLIAVHFYSSLLEVNNKKGNKRVLVVSSLKNSMTLLLRQTLLKWFSGTFSLLDFKHEIEVTEEDIDEYDIFLTTDKGELYEKGIAMLINTFPNDHDFMNIKLILDGFKDIEDILQIFNESLFFVDAGKTKQDVLKKLCDCADETFDLESLYDQVMVRENRGSTYFGGGIAVPHPMYAVSSDTFAAVAVNSEPLEWDEENHQVNLVVLLCVGKNNPQAFQLWDYIAKIFANKVFAQKIAAHPVYKNFQEIIRESLKGNIQF